MSKDTRIGVNIAPEAFAGQPKEIAEAIAMIFQAGYDCHMTPETIHEALHTLTNTGMPPVELRDVSISDL